MAEDKKKNDCPGNPVPTVSINAGRLIYEMYTKLLHMAEEVAVIKSKQDDAAKEVSWLRTTMRRLLFLFIGLLTGIIINLIAVLIT